MSEEKTRIVSRTPPKVAPDQITFACENGHRIVVAAKLAGKRGTCSKCGIPVVIPTREGGPVAIDAGQKAESAEPAAVAAPDEIVISTAAAVDPAAVAEEPAAAEESPSRKDEFAGLFDVLSADQSPGSSAGAGAEYAIEVSADGEAASEPGSSGIGNVVANEPTEGYANDYDADGVADNPTAQLVTRLWAEREHGGKFEIHVTGGGVILPQWYEPRWSRGTHGLFANQAADGTVTLTAVAWESVQKIIVRQVEGLPDGMFE
jgi:hypothetical protein